MQYSINPEALKLLQFYDWPGNVRELENCLERAVAMSPGLGAANLRTFLLIYGRPPFAPWVRKSKPGSFRLAELEKQAILDALHQLNGDKLMTARALGIGKTTLYRKLKEYGIAHWISPPMQPPTG